MFQQKYAEYLKLQIGHPQCVCSLKEAETLWLLLNSFRPKRIMDAGVGFSTYVILRYLFENYDSVDRVTLVDNSAITIYPKLLRFCQNEQLEVNDDKVYIRVLDRIVPKGGFFQPIDFLHYDYKLGVFRNNEFNRFYECVAPQGVIFVPDMQNEKAYNPYRENTEALAYSTDAKFIPYKELTIDELGRYAAVILKK